MLQPILTVLKVSAIAGRLAWIVRMVEIDSLAIRLGCCTETGEVGGGDGFGTAAGDQ